MRFRPFRQGRMNRTGAVTSHVSGASGTPAHQIRLARDGGPRAPVNCWFLPLWAHPSPRESRIWCTWTPLAGADARPRPAPGRIIAARLIGTAFEWYDNSSDRCYHPHVPSRSVPKMSEPLHRPDSADLPWGASTLTISQGRLITDVWVDLGTDRRANDDRFQPLTALDGEWALCESLDRSGPIVFIGRGPELPDVPGGSGTSGGPDRSRPSAGPRGRAGCHEVAGTSPNPVAAASRWRLKLNVRQPAPNAASARSPVLHLHPAPTS